MNWDFSDKLKERLIKDLRTDIIYYSNKQVKNEEINRETDRSSVIEDLCYEKVI